MYGFLFIVCTVLCSKHIILKGPFNVELYRMVYWARRLFLDFSRVMHFSVTTREFSSILEGVKKLSPQFPPAKNLLQVKESFMRPFKIHLHKHFGRKVTRKYIFQRKQKKSPISQRKGPFASKRTIINDSRPTPHQKPFVEVSRTSLAILFFASILSKILWASRSPLSLETYKRNYVDTKEKE